MGFSIQTVLAGTLLGFVRFGCFFAGLVTFLSHVSIPPTVPNYADFSIGTVFLAWKYIRVILETIFCLWLCADATVTLTSLSGYVADQFSFIYLFRTPGWLTRIYLTLIVAGSFSCNVYSTLGANYIIFVQQTYLYLHILVLTCGAFAVLFNWIPGFRRLPWFDRRAADPLTFSSRHKELPLAWTPAPIKTILGTKQGAKERYEKISTLVIPLFAAALNFLAIITVAAGIATPLCDSWGFYLNHGTQIMLSVVVCSELINALRLKKKSEIPFLTKCVSVYLISASMTPDVALSNQNWALIILLVLAPTVLILPMCPWCFTWLRDKKKREETLNARKKQILAFISNFKDTEKLFRILSVLSTISSLSGCMFAVLSIPLNWFRIDFSADDTVQELLDLKDQFEKKMNTTLQELEKVIDVALNDLHVDELARCEVFIPALISAIALGAVPFAGPVAAKIQVTFFRAAKFMYRMAKKALSYRKQFSKVRSGVKDVGTALNSVKDAMFIGVSIRNYGLVVFVLPAIVTGIVTFFFAFWPRKIPATTDAQSKKKRALVMASALLLFAFNGFCLLVFELWGPALEFVADSLPLSNAKLVKESGWFLIEAAFGCGIIASFLYLIMASMSGWKDVKGDIKILVEEDIQPRAENLRSRLRQENEDNDRTKTKCCPSFSVFRRKSKAGKKSSHAVGSSGSSPASSPRPIPKKHFCGATLPHLDAGSTSLLADSPTTSKPKRKPAKKKTTSLYLTLGVVPPRGWILPMFLCSIALIISIWSLNEPWISFNPEPKGSLAVLIGKARELSSSGLVLRDDFKEDSNTCDLFPIPIKSIFKKFLSLSFLRTWKSFIQKLVEIFPDVDINTAWLKFAISLPVSLKIVTIVPPIACFVMVVIGLLSSVSEVSRFYMSMDEIMTWIGKIAMFAVLVMMNTLIFFLNLLQDVRIPLITVETEIQLGFILGLASQLLVVLVWVGMHVEIIAYPHYKEKPPTQGTRTTKTTIEVTETSSTQGTGLLVPESGQFMSGSAPNLTNYSSSSRTTTSTHASTTVPRGITGLTSRLSPFTKRKDNKSSPVTAKKVSQSPSSSLSDLRKKFDTTKL